MLNLHTESSFGEQLCDGQEWQDMTTLEVVNYCKSNISYRHVQNAWIYCFHTTMNKNLKLISFCFTRIICNTSRISAHPQCHGERAAWLFLSLPAWHSVWEHHQPSVSGELQRKPHVHRRQLPAIWCSRPLRRMRHCGSRSKRKVTWRRGRSEHNQNWLGVLWIVKKVVRANKGLSQTWVHWPIKKEKKEVN